MSSGSASPGSSPLPLETDVRTVAAKLETATAGQAPAGKPFLLVDCREPDEYKRVHIAGAMLLPMSELPDRVAELTGHRDHEIVVHCHHGGRSLRVTRWLREQGFANVKSMAGGIDAWSLEIDSSLPRY